jgi:SET domain-containing protein
MGLIIRSSSIHAAGCYTTEPIANGTAIIEYTGRRITKEEADELYSDAIVTYLFGVGDGSYVIDGHSVAMFINHSCEPNCETDDTDGRVWIRAIRDIAAGEELVYDYNLYDGNDDPCYCNCGFAGCRGSMYSVDELKKRARAAKRLLGTKNGGRKKRLE